MRMRKVIQLVFVLAGGAAAMFGAYNNDSWVAGIGGLLFLVGMIAWIASPSSNSYPNSGKDAEYNPGPPPDGF